MTVEKPNQKQLQQQENGMAWLKPKPLPGFEIATNTVAFATKFFPLRLKYLEKSQICERVTTSQTTDKKILHEELLNKFYCGILSQNCDWIFSLISSPDYPSWSHSLTWLASWINNLLVSNN